MLARLLRRTIGALNTSSDTGAVESDNMRKGCSQLGSVASRDPGQDASRRQQGGAEDSFEIRKNFGILQLEKSEPRKAQSAFGEGVIVGRADNRSYVRWRRGKGKLNWKPILYLLLE